MGGRTSLATSWLFLCLPSPSDFHLLPAALLCGVEHRGHGHVLETFETDFTWAKRDRQIKHVTMCLSVASGAELA